MVFKGFWVHTVVLVRHDILRVFVLSLSQAVFIKYFQLSMCLSAFINDYVLRQYCEIFNYCLVM
jgi:hypothetical protein